MSNIDDKEEKCCDTQGNCSHTQWSEIKKQYRIGTLTDRLEFYYQECLGCKIVRIIHKL